MVARLSRSIPPCIGPVPNDATQHHTREGFLGRIPGNRNGIGFLFSVGIHLALILVLSLIVYVPKQALWLTMQMSSVDGAGEIPVQFADLSFTDVSDSAAQQDDSISLTAFDLDDAFAEQQLQRLMPDDDAKTGEMQAGAEVEEPQSPQQDRPVQFFGTHAYGKKFVYVLDVSGSMKGARLLRAQRELVKSVRALPEDYMFHVVLFNEGVFNFGATASLRPATRANKRLLERWIATAYAQSGTLPGPALKIAGDLHPDHVFFLSDGDFEIRSEQQGGVQGLLDLLVQAGNAKPNPFQAAPIDNYVSKSILDGYAPDIVIHTFAYENMAGFETLKTIAENQGGTCRFIAPIR